MMTTTATFALSSSMMYRGPLQERNMQRGVKAGPSAPSQAPRQKASAAAAGSKRPMRPVSPDLRTSKRARASAAGPPLQQVRCFHAHYVDNLLAQCGAL